MVLNRSNHKSVNVVVWLLLRPEKEIISDSAFDFSQSLTTVKRDTDISFLRAKKSQQKNILIFLFFVHFVGFNLISEDNLTRKYKATITLP